MGNQQTRQTKSEQLVFHNDPPVPVTFSASFLRQLQGLPSDNIFPFENQHQPAAPSDAELETIIQQRVAYETELQQQRSFNYEARSADQVRREAEDLIRRARGAPLPSPKPEYADMEQQLVDCYRNKHGRPLDCWREVEEFKEMAKAAERDFVLGI
ncbi:hypothetical protein SeMB42_g00375 [Synchytrium endobioticum]|uniref:Uncharacterized protein n=1 Tax=Synchytrium endobioticum TaxID=286115 RepID=A0A507DRY3_9FUNG|nr:hypothetical protein SeLEV6574_g01285 [Synchytrium endobioticum]TPX54296.1 hypothetical protein SeMB42_g00375 [Synchytrium endobioticum]